MMGVDRALEERRATGRPVQVGIVGAGFMAQGLVNQIVNSVPGMRVAAVSNRHVDKAEGVYADAGAGEVERVSSSRRLEQAMREDRPAVTDDPSLLCAADGIEAIVDVTGAVDFGAHVALDAIANGKHLILMNAELDATLGPVLAQRAAAADVIYTACDGDQPGVQANLVRFVRSIGLTPLVVGNIKGLHDPYRTPTTQEAFARRWGQNPWMVTSFADGTKISFEQATVANGFGLTVAQRGMLGWDHDGHVDGLVDRFDVDELRDLGGIVDYVVRAQPSPGVFVLGTHDDPRQRHYLKLYKLGDGPLYSFYTPYHLCHFEVPISVARAVLMGDAVLRALPVPTVEVVAAAKRDLRAGETIDGLGGYMTYGLAERASIQRREGLLPMGVAEGCRLLRNVMKDTVLTTSDVEPPTGRLVDQLRNEQDRLRREREAGPVSVANQ